MKSLLLLCVTTLLLGSCTKDQYAIETIGAFSDKVPECSGLIMWDRNLVTINDSGNKPKIHIVSAKSAKHKDSNKIKKATNKDWEALTSDENYIYIGDFGNNNGSREDLTIYRLEKGKRKIKEITKIPFGYRDQKNFEKRSKHNHDCEAMIIDQGMITLFSKNRLDDSSSVYIVDPNQTLQYPSKTSTFHTGYMITDATLHHPSGKVVCAAYNYVEGGFAPALLVLKKTDGQYMTEHTFPLDMNHQIEGITWSKGRTFFLGSESEEGLEGSLFKVKLSKEVLK